LACDQGECRCAAGTSWCNGSCIDTTSDPDNCGGCGNQCDPDFEVCSNGDCECTGGLTMCDGQCRDLQNDPRRCGGCDTQCGDAEVCSSGTCACRPGLTECNGNCVDMQSDPRFCGDCNTECGTNQLCQDGSCASASGGCDGGLEACQVPGDLMGCFDLETSPLHCGDCGQVCANDELCVSGECYTYRPASPCTTCPCDSICNELVDNPRCCDVGSSLICLEDAPACP
jgi:hypothetical protein